MPSDQVAFYIELKVRPEHGHVYVSSEQVPGLHLMGFSFQSMRRMIETAITHLYRDNHGENVKVIWLAPAESFPAIGNVPERLAVCKLAA